VHYAMESAAKPEGATVRYTIEAKRSSFTVRAFATGMLAALGHNPTIGLPDVEGEIVLNPDAIEQSSLRMEIQTGSMSVIGDVSEKDREEVNRRMHEEVLESGDFPVVIYECMHESSSKISEGEYWLALNGELTLHGVTRNQAVSARLSLNGSTLRATGDFSIRQSDYEIPPVSVLGGAIRLKDELKLSFTISANKQS
jgi:polyisoprenoid-binding protein YceI